jgi:hypothetical protein
MVLLKKLKKTPPAKFVTRPPILAHGIRNGRYCYLFKSADDARSLCNSAKILGINQEPISDEDVARLDLEPLPLVANAK